MRNLIYKNINITLIITLGVILFCSSLAHAGDASLRVPSSFEGEDEDFVDRTKRVFEKINSELQGSPANIIGTLYNFGEFKEIAKGAYEGELLINTVLFDLKVTITDESFSNVPLFSYVYTIFYKGERVADAFFIARKYPGSEKFIPEVQGIEVNPDYQKAKILMRQSLLKNVSLDSVLINIMLKDMSLDYRIGLAKVIYKNAMAPSSPNPGRGLLLKTFEMTPLDTGKIIQYIKKGHPVNIRRGESMEPYLAIATKRFPSGHQDYVAVIIKKKGNLKLGIDDKIAELIKFKKNTDVQNLENIIRGRNPQYNSYIGGNWGLRKDRIRYMERYLKSIPSWYQHTSELRDKSVYGYMLGWWGWFRRGAQWKETRQIIDEKFKIARDYFNKALEIKREHGAVQIKYVGHTEKSRGMEFELDRIRKVPKREGRSGI